MKRLISSFGVVATLSLAACTATVHTTEVVHEPGPNHEHERAREEAREAREEEMAQIMARLNRERVEIEVEVPVPAPRPEPPRPPPPRPHAVYVPGFWHWEGDRATGHWLWVGGHWDLVEHDGAVWIEPHYDHRAGGGVHYVGGYWETSVPR